MIQYSDESSLGELLTAAQAEDLRRVARLLGYMWNCQSIHRYTLGPWISDHSDEELSLDLELRCGRHQGVWRLTKGLRSRIFSRRLRLQGHENGHDLTRSSYYSDSTAIAAALSSLMNSCGQRC